MDNLTIVANAMRRHYIRHRDGDTVHWLDRYTHQALCGSEIAVAPVAGDGLKLDEEPITCTVCREAYWSKREEALRTLSMPYVEECHQ